MNENTTTSATSTEGALPQRDCSACLGGMPKSFATCPGCTDDTCGEIKECLVEIYNEIARIEEGYIAKGICSDCGACSLKDAAGKCRPKSLGDTGDYTCGGVKLWEGQEDEEPQPRRTGFCCCSQTEDR